MRMKDRLRKAFSQNKDLDKDEVKTLVGICFDVITSQSPDNEKLGQPCKRVFSFIFVVGGHGRLQ